LRGVEAQQLDREAAGLTPLRNNVGQVVHTLVPLSL